MSTFCLPLLATSNTFTGSMDDTRAACAGQVDDTSCPGNSGSSSGIQVIDVDLMC